MSWHFSRALGVEPADVPRVAVGVDNRTARLTCIGNGQVPQAACLAWSVLLSQAGMPVSLNGNQGGVGVVL